MKTLYLWGVSFTSHINPFHFKWRDLLLNWDLSIGSLQFSVCHQRQWLASIRRRYPPGSPYSYHWQIKLIGQWGFKRFGATPEDHESK